MTMPENTAFLPFQGENSAQDRNISDTAVSYPITSVEPGDLKECGFTKVEMTYLTEYLPEIARKMADVYLETRYWEDLRFFAKSILDRIVPSNPQAEIGYYLEEMVTYTQEEAQRILGAFHANLWFTEGGKNAQGHGCVLPAKFLSKLPKGISIPPEIRERHVVGLLIDGDLSSAGTLSKEVIQQFWDILGEARVWCAWPDFALVLPDVKYANPMDDPLLALLALAVPLCEVFRTLADLKLTFIDLYEGYLIIQKEQGQFETWPMLPDGRGIDENLTELLPVVKYQGDLYRYGNTYSRKEEIYPAIQREIEK